MASDEVKARLEYLRSQIHAECISYGELFELQGLIWHIDPGDVELLEWAGVPEHACEACGKPRSADPDFCADCLEKMRVAQTEQA